VTVPLTSATAVVCAARRITGNINTIANQIVPATVSRDGNSGETLNVN
jgi:hypothetical protein